MSSTAEEVIFSERFPVEKGDFAAAGEASSSIKRILKKLGISPVIIREVAIASYELELNLVIHSLGGFLLLEMTRGALMLTSQDRGPGIADTTLALKEGYSTASEAVRNMGFGAGMGLPNIKRHSHRFSIDSEVSVGTCIKIEYDL